MKNGHRPLVTDARLFCYAACYPIGVIPVDTLTDLYSLNFVVLFSVLKDFILNV